MTASAGCAGEVGLGEATPGPTSATASASTAAARTGVAGARSICLLGIDGTNDGRAKERRDRRPQGSPKPTTERAGIDERDHGQGEGEDEKLWARVGSPASRGYPP